ELERSMLADPCRRARNQDGLHRLAPSSSFSASWLLVGMNVHSDDGCGCAVPGCQPTFGRTSAADRLPNALLTHGNRRVIETERAVASPLENPAKRTPHEGGKERWGCLPKHLLSDPLREERRCDDEELPFDFLAGRVQVGSVVLELQELDDVDIFPGEPA